MSDEQPAKLTQADVEQLRSDLEEIAKEGIIPTFAVSACDGVLSATVLNHAWRPAMDAKLIAVDTAQPDAIKVCVDIDGQTTWETIRVEPLDLVLPDGAMSVLVASDNLQDRFHSDLHALHRLCGLVRRTLHGDKVALPQVLATSRLGDGLPPIAEARRVSASNTVVDLDAPPPGIRLMLWVIYEHPRDDPYGYVVRQHVVFVDRVLPTNISTHHETAEAARASLPAGLRWQPRVPEDDPAILEVWY